MPRDLHLQANEFDELSDDELRARIRQLDEFFLLVVVGEFNAGKSSVVNALFGEPIMEEGPVPTTDKITVLRYGERPETHRLGEFVTERRHPSPLLRDLALAEDDEVGGKTLLEHAAVCEAEGLRREPGGQVLHRRSVAAAVGAVAGGVLALGEVPLEGLEFGARGQYSDTFSYAATIFHYNWERLRSGTALPFPLYLVNNIEGDSYGIEGWATWQLTPRWQPLQPTPAFVALIVLVGVLELTIPKVAKPEPRRIEVEAA